MGYSTFTFNGVPVKSPSKFKIDRYNITDFTRLTNGDAVGDLIAKKHKFYFTYNVITSREMDTILNAIWNDAPLFFTLTYVERGTTQSYTVYSGAIPTQLHRGDSDEWIWRDVSFDLIEK